MNEERAKRKLTAILSADVKGYSRLMGEDELATIETLKKHQELISSLIYQYRGRVIDSPGDNLLAEFGSAVDAVECAMKIQEDLKKENDELPERRRMDFRIGVNLGDVVEDGERIYGDGVNIAARIEALADGGGICISRTAYDHVKNKISTGYEYLGEHRVKNIKDPVGVYRLLPDAEAKGSVVYKRKRDDPRHRKRSALMVLIGLVVAIAAFLIWHFYLRGPSIEPASVERMAFPLPDKPSIAVLPFTNMSGDPEQEYIGDGLSENIISAISLYPFLFVISRNSTFTYKGKPVKVQQVAEDLGVQYVLEGSIQKSGDRLRVTAQLIDALSGHHLWSEKYDREMKGLFDLQDEITKNIVESIAVEFVGKDEALRVFGRSTDSLDAWRQMRKGVTLFLKFRNREDNAKAREHFKAAEKIDPEYGPAVSMQAWTHLMDAQYGWSNSPPISGMRAFELAQKALKLDEQDSSAHAALASIYIYRRQHEKAIAAARRSITLSPNFAQGIATLALAMHWSGEFDEAISLYNKAFRLDPYLQPIYLFALYWNYIFLGRYDEAIEVIKQMEEHATRGNLPMWYPLIGFSCVYQELGREEEARAYMVEALKANPKLSIEWFKMATFYKNPAHLHQLLDSFRKAGMPEKPPGAAP